MRTATTHLYRQIILICLMSVMPALASSQLSDWTNYTNIGMVNSILDDGDYLWLATDAGVVKYNKKTEEKVVYNRSNAGLPENRIMDLAKDADGSIWISTLEAGIGKLEGNKCTVYNSSNSELPSDQMCLAIMVDKDNNKWIGTYDYLVKYDGKKWESWSTTNGSIFSYGIIYDFKFDKDNKLWLGGRLEDYRFGMFDGEKIELLEGVSRDVYSIAIDKNGIKWLATEGGLVKYDGNTFVCYNTQNSDLPMDDIHELAIDDDNNIWLGCNRYLVCFDGTDFITYETPLINDDNNFIKSIVISDDQTIWIGTRRNGLIKYSDGNFKAVLMSNPLLITNNIGFSGQVDPEGSFWFNTFHNLMKLDKNNVWHSYLEKINNFTGESRTGGFGVAPSGDVWVALGRSDTIVAKMKDGKVTAAFTRKNTPCFKPFIQADCRFRFDGKGNVWLASRTGLYKYDGNEWTWYNPSNSPIESGTIFDVAFDKDGNLWGGAGNEFEPGCLFKYDGTNWETFTPKNSGLPTAIIAALAFDSKNNLWIHCRDGGNAIGQELGGGLTKYDGNTWKTYHTGNSGLPSNSILDIAIDKNDHIWLATYGGVGITLYDGKSWTIYNTENSGIAHNEVSKITFDYGRDLVWLNHLNSNGISSAKLNGSSSIENNRLDQSDAGFIICNDRTGTNLHLQFNDNLKPEKLELFDMSGRPIACRKLETSGSQTFSVPLSELNIRQSGLYLIKLTTASHVYTQKFMVDL